MDKHPSKPLKMLGFEPKIMDKRLFKPQQKLWTNTHPNHSKSLVFSQKSLSKLESSLERVCNLVCGIASLSCRVLTRTTRETSCGCPGEAREIRSCRAGAHRAGGEPRGSPLSWGCPGEAVKIGFCRAGALVVEPRGSPLSRGTDSCRAGAPGEAAKIGSCRAGAPRNGLRTSTKLVKFVDALAVALNAPRAEIRVCFDCST